MKENTRRTIEYPGIGMTLKPPWGAPGLTYPAQLTVKAEYGVDGEELWRAS